MAAFVPRVQSLLAAACAACCPYCNIDVHPYAQICPMTAIVRRVALPLPRQLASAARGPAQHQCLECASRDSHLLFMMPVQLLAPYTPAPHCMHDSNAAGGLIDGAVAISSVQDQTARAWFPVSLCG